MIREEFVDIDTIADFEYAEYLMQHIEKTSYKVCISCFT